MSDWFACALSFVAAAFAWRASPSANASSRNIVRGRRAGYLAGAFALLSSAQWIDAHGWPAGLCATCVSIGASCSVTPFAVEVVRRLRIRIRARRPCHFAS
ncbi:hypothetical protein AB1286_07435 [Trinickia sp. NRRL B-1857]|uniref:hypothetical protein n=1 Tax=Trinickia sp. NRRL B-1857 TaxID=3162879 RepID=UPI003D2AA2D0